MINHIMIIIFRTTTLAAGVFEKGHLSLAALISPWKGACYDKKITLLSDDVIWPRWRRFKLMLKFVAPGEMAMSVTWSIRYFGSGLKYLIKAYSLATLPLSQAKKTKVGIQIDIKPWCQCCNRGTTTHLVVFIRRQVCLLVYLVVVFRGNTYQQGNGLRHNAGARHQVNTHHLCLLRQQGFFPQLFHFSRHYLGTLTVENSVSSFFGCPWQMRSLYAVVQPSHFQNGF